MISVFKNLKKENVAQNMTRAEGENALKAKLSEDVKKEYHEALVQAASEGIVLLENDGVLPVKEKTKAAVFGRCAYDTFFVGYGSGGDTHSEHCISYYEGLSASETIVPDEDLYDMYDYWFKLPKNKEKQYGWGEWPLSKPEMPIEESTFGRMADRNELAILVFGRNAGEALDAKPKAGSYYMTEEEKKLFTAVTKEFDKVVVVLNLGNVMDLSFLEKNKDKFNALVLAWHGGEVAGEALSDVLTGKRPACGHLTDTIAFELSDYPCYKNFGGKKKNIYEEDIFVGYRYFETFEENKVLYPFGYGKSYTDFIVTCDEFERKDGSTRMSFNVSNTGNEPGRKVIMIFAAPPAGKLANPTLVLCGFAKTKCLAPGESEKLEIKVFDRSFASFDDMGLTDYTNCFILEEGSYELYYGENIRDITLAGGFELEKDVLVSKGSDALAPVEKFDRLTIRDKKGFLGRSKLVKSRESAPTAETSYYKNVMENLPKGDKYDAEKELHFEKVLEGSITVDDFLMGVPTRELCALTVGHGGMNSSLGIPGNAGTIGGVSKHLMDKGVPAVTTTDGPAGVRYNGFATILPSGVCIASSFDTALAERLYTCYAKEAKAIGTDIVLAPGMNIHRSPLCGRNFEYYSEDPYLTGKMAAAAVRGFKTQNIAACPKHFAANNQETNRNKNDSVVSMRALREIYLKGFEIVIKEAKPWVIMSSYNKINGRYSHYNYDLCERILRGEWGYDGLVITDWWMERQWSDEFPELRDNALRVRSGVDVMMPGSFKKLAKKYEYDSAFLESEGKEDGITRGELLRSAKRTLELVIRLKGKDAGDKTAAPEE